MRTRVKGRGRPPRRHGRHAEGYNEASDCELGAVLSEVVLPVEDLRIGMFVADLDRPWLETPFLLQGFLIESAEDIARLQACCRHVVIDRERSVGDQYVADPRSGKTALGEPRGSAHPAAMPPSPVAAASASSESDFLPIARRLRERRPATAPHIPRPRLAPSGGPSRLESELLQSAPIIEDVHRTLDEVRNAIDADARFDLARIGGLVEEMAACQEM